ncbi:hypothetical protein MNBD_ALPHA07-2114 [hydrothermal vent metagenome]|uniref:Capsule polysaccharide biosynthesis protein n=1 Tax=hydrothermal vent metagenome TaxID=652676 RepID=A0A3B0S7E8_9ZZZZ
MWLFRIAVYTVADLRPKIILHLKKNDLHRDLMGWHLQLYKVLRAMAEEAGIIMEINARDTDIKVGTRAIHDGRFDDGNLHIIDDRSVCAPNVLNAGVAYFWRFWHLDAQGVKAFSSIGDQPYHPDQMAYRRAKPFYDRMCQRYVAKRKSKYDQPQDVQTFASGAVSVFFQGTYPVASGATKISDLEMLKVVLDQTGDRPIIVKPHPKASTASDIENLKNLTWQDERVCITGANVHDILRASCATVSINSTVALEGFLHKKPAILFGKSDFHHFTGTVSSQQSFKEIFARELERKDGYVQFLAWYFLKNCLSLNNGKLIPRIWDKFEDAEFPQERFD